MVHPKTMVLPADEDGRDYVSTTRNFLLDLTHANDATGWCTYMKITKQTSCAVWCFTSFKHVRRISPTAPITAVTVAIIDSDFWNQEVFTANFPRCRSQRSAIKTKSKVTTVTAPIAMKSGCRLWAPISEIYLLLALEERAH